MKHVDACDPFWSPAARARSAASSSPRLRDAGRRVRVLSRHSRAAEDGVEYVTGDLATGEGVDAAVDGVEIVVHCAGSSQGRRGEGRAPGPGGGAGRGAAPGVHLGRRRRPGPGRQRRRPRHVRLLRVQAARPSEVVADSGLPWTTLRATQFHDLVFTTVRQMAKLPVMPVPR